MRSSKGVLAGQLVDLLWSLWAELGVASVIRRHADAFVDLEPLLILTGLHGDAEPRLRDEAIDWLIKYGQYVSKPRLKNLLVDHGVAEDLAFRRFAATVNRHAGLGWPDGDIRAIDFRPRARPLIKDLAAASLIGLRLRAIFGVGARAEVIRVFIGRPDTAMTAADLAAETGYRKRNVLDSVETLRMAGVLSGFTAGNATHYRLARRTEIESIAGDRPADFPRWHAILFELNALANAIKGSMRLTALERAAAAHRVLEQRGDRLRAAGLYPPALPTGTGGWQTFEGWATELIRFYARAER